MMSKFLALRAKCAWLWRFGIISRGTAFRWEMDRALGEYTRRATRYGEWTGGGK